MIDSEYVTRGKKRILDLIGLALSLRASRLIIIQAKKGNPSKLDFYGIATHGAQFLGSLLLSGVKLKKEQKRITRPPAGVKLTIFYEECSAPVELRKTAMLIPLMFDLEASTSDEDRWVMKIKILEYLIEVSFIDRETALSFGPIVRVRGFVQPSA